MSRTVIFGFEGSVRPLDGADKIPLRHWEEPVRFACRLPVLRRLQVELEPSLRADPPVVFMGSGDFHHISYVLIERFRRRGERIQVVVLDNHPDNMRYPFGIHCGSWVWHVSQLPFVARVHVVGITSNDVEHGHAIENHLAPLRSGRVVYWCVRRNLGVLRLLGARDSRSFPSGSDLLGRRGAELAGSPKPWYVSIDKDGRSLGVVQDGGDDARGAGDRDRCESFAEQSNRNDEYRGDVDVRGGEGGTNGRVLEQRHPGDKGAEVAGDGDIDPGCNCRCPEPGEREREFASPLCCELERNLRQRVEHRQHGEPDDIEARPRHANPPASATPTAMSAKPATRVASSRSRKNNLPASATTTMLIEPIRIACESGMRESSASQTTNSRQKQRIPAQSVGERSIPFHRCHSPSTLPVTAADLNASRPAVSSRTLPIQSQVARVVMGGDIRPGRR